MSITREYWLIVTKWDIKVNETDEYPFIGATVFNKTYPGPWIWASVEAPVEILENLFPGSPCRKQLADVRDVEVSLVTDFKFGSVDGGWLWLWGSLKTVSGSETCPRRGSRLGPDDSLVTFLTDATTGAEMWFRSATTEGFEMAASDCHLNNIVWMPLLFAFDRGVGCKGLVLTEVAPNEGFGEANFIRPGERVYRRLGLAGYHGSLKKDALLMALGEDPRASDIAEVANSFIRNEAGYEEFAIV
ncbi:hypothetical protein B0H67DRAFT_648919 [Lasiosphaeris hirsuta]|uniref:Uncharacterized protein n=1 Tax=Lasiosphaeris hirsuta TaxID=260670 RepID=A0AA39ZVU6_9PEZI|nr:hypothetical protein B0H67DRAFT_648919 [Lasiosphaeris hirsuta]